MPLRRIHAGARILDLHTISAFVLFETGLIRLLFLAFAIRNRDGLDLRQNLLFEDYLLLGISRFRLLGREIKVNPTVSLCTISMEPGSLSPLMAESVR